MPVWNRISDVSAGIASSVSDAISIVEWRNPGVLRSVSCGDMVILSDYSGQHKNSLYEAYSFLVNNMEAVSEWTEVRREFREKWLPDGRRISFKQLNEKVRAKAYPHYLAACSLLKANIITFLVHRNIKHFINGGAVSFMELFPECFSSQTKHGKVEKMIRLSTFLSVVITGLRQEYQRAFWFSDHDEALENHERREGFAKLSAYLQLHFSRWKRPADVIFGTTEDPSIPFWVEDLAALPDIFCGAYCQMGNILPSFYGKETWTRMFNSSSVSDNRSRILGDWLAAGPRELKHIFVRTEIEDSGFFRSSAQFFRPLIYTW